MFRDRRGMMRWFLLVVVIMAGASFGLRSEPAEAAPGPQMITVVCVNQYTGILRYVTTQPCQGHEQRIEIPADLPFALCVNQYTKIARLDGVPAGCQPHEHKVDIPSPEEALGCANKYTNLIRIVDSHAQCQPHEVQVFFLALTDAIDDTFDTVGNVQISVPASDGVLSNDKGTDLSVTAHQNPSASGGAVGMGADGDFVYNPPVGFLGVDTFTYTVLGADGNVDVATVTVNVNGPLVWFVDNSAPAGGDGSLRNPFDSLAPVNNAFDVDGPGDVIFVYHGNSAVTPYNTPFDLEPGQQLIGQARELASAAGFTAPPFAQLPAIDTVPTLTSPLYGVQLEVNTKVAGMSIQNTASVGIVGTTITGNVAIDAVRVTNTPAGVPCILLSQVDGDVIGSHMWLNNCGGSGLQMLNGAGLYQFSGALEIGSVGGDGVHIGNNAAWMTFQEINVDGANRGLVVQNSSQPVLVDGNDTGTGGGGTIQNTVAEPIVLDNAYSVSPRFMNIIAGTDAAGNGIPAITALNNSVLITDWSDISAGNGTSGGGGTAIFCDASVCNIFHSMVQGGHGGVGAVGMSGGPGVHAINDGYVHVGDLAEIRGGNGADNAVPGAGADGILAQNATVIAYDSFVAGGNGGAGGAGGMGGTAIDVDVLASFYDVELYTNTLQGGVHGAGGNSTSLNVETFGGSTCVHASGNSATGGFRLTNGGGTLGITQANIGDLSIDNGFVSVAIIGGITYNC